MTLYTSDIRPNMKKGALIFAGISVFSLIFYLIYDRFSHNVRSPYMTWLFLWTLILGVLPCLILLVINKLPRPGRITINLYCSGVAALTVSSLLRGIFEIAGTASPLQKGLFIAGLSMTALGVLSYMLQPFVTASPSHCRKDHQAPYQGDISGSYPPQDRQGLL